MGDGTVHVERDVVVGRNGSPSIADHPGPAMPTRVKVGPFVYRVLLDRDKLREFEQAKRRGYSGFTDHAKLEIVIDPTQAPAQHAEMLWHEVKHCVIHLFGEYGKQDDETWVRRTSAMELATLRENPLLVAYLVHAEFP
jgi:hypothetical protein